MWQRFTERARRVILLAQEEAGKLGSSHVGTEHLLLGLVRQEDGVGAQVLRRIGVDFDAVRAQVFAEVEDSSPVTPEPKLTPKAKRVLELSADEARRMRHNYIGTEHILLALLRQKDGLAAVILGKLGLDLEQARTSVLSYLDVDDPLASGSDATTNAPASPLEQEAHKYSDKILAKILQQMLSDDEGIAARLLGECGLDTERARARLARFLSGE